MGTERFFENLPAFSAFQGVTEESHYQPVPEDWLAVISDIKGSTKAIEAGNYKDVNLLGATTIIAVLNAVKGHPIPYVFGGDGASFVIPPGLKLAVSQALVDTQTLAQGGFGMELRIGMVPVAELIQQDAVIKVAKHRVAKAIDLAMFWGGGLAQAEKLIKDPVTGPHYEIKATEEMKGKTSFQGLECRWKPVKSLKGETVSLLVQARGKSPAEEGQIYAAVISHIEEVFGDHENYRPVNRSKMKLAFDSKNLSRETKVHTTGQGFWSYLKYLTVLKITTLLGALAFRFGWTLGTMDGKTYPDKVAQNTDFRKFDDTLRMIIDATTPQREELVAYLEKERAAGRIFYGVSVSDSALMTCLIFDRQDRHIHFVDGSAGGYAVAAKQMKAQIKAAQ